MTSVVVSEAFRRSSETLEMVTVGAVVSMTVASYPVSVTEGAVALAVAFPMRVITVKPDPGVALIVAEVQFPRTTLVEGLELIEPPASVPDEAIIVPDRVEAVPAPVVTAAFP